MDDQGHGDKPTTGTDGDTPPPSPSQGHHPKGQITENGKHGTEGNKKATNILARELHWVEGFQLAFSAILAIVGIIALIVYSRQLDAMRGQSTTMAQTLETMFIQTKTMQAGIEIAKDANRLARDAAGASERKSNAALDASIQSSRNDQRAWVGVDGIKTTPEPIAPNKIDIIIVTFKNTGRSPAIDLQGTVRMEAVPQHVSPHLDYRGADVIRFGLFPPGGTNVMSFPIASENEEPRLLRPDDFAQLVSGGKRLYIHGQITYRDTFRRLHWMTLCYSPINILGPSIFAACPGHNDTGDGEPPDNSKLNVETPMR